MNASKLGIHTGEVIMWVELQHSAISTQPFVMRMYNPRRIYIPSIVDLHYKMLNADC
jgi:hypothetical protein